MALISRPWIVGKDGRCRNCISDSILFASSLLVFQPHRHKAALKILGLQPCIRRPYPELEGEKLAELRVIMTDLGVIDKYGRRKARLCKTRN